ncbi:DNA mismatch repair endonuclease MutL [Dysgonomonas sp. 216]|uniref:DNA mismatch repair endonuclease MutL n=1 Tax=Dysgonomonas sp. 216 TaxID=2302934 RepID=UPI0013D6555A|nr:DNA mismatch repair endonuclease MutL [Dysgonomonas sp. 216]NDW18345.1 DNA mismatch repair endonuclease MutL [Dysgonomonas sp. 216]NDW18713.1 DNA mismatch repair endonuclease MutL [Dysgonomonas sp. 216]
MSDIIHLLPDSIANQIAAGEVIQRPASVVKELVENAIDAGADDIQIIIKDAGRTLIQVIDNGKGMSVTDARLAFERHATSKIKSAEDLFGLRTMGFRGEALPSIAAISHVELRTRQEDDEVGTLISILGSKVENQECVACPKGSNFSIKNIFFNVPARRKFLKSNETEKKNILTELERIALVNPEINFTFIENDIEVLKYPQTSLKQRILNVIGKGFNQQLIPIEIETTLAKIRGFVGKPESARKARAQQYFFVNGRYMRHPYFAKAVTSAYESLISVGENPNFFIYFEVAPSTIDVNIHPTKTEIKFENEQPLWQILAATVKSALGKSNEVPAIDFDTQDAIDIPIHNPDLNISHPQINIDPTFNPFKQSGSSGGGNSSYKRPQMNWETLYEGFEKEKGSNKEQFFPDNENEGTSLFSPNTQDEKLHESHSIHYQYKNKYIITSVKSGLMFIDQRRAHVRILFDRFLYQIQQKKGVSQRVLFPEIIELSASEASMVPYLIDDFDAVGFDLSNLGNNSYAINGIPSELNNVNATDLVRNMINKSIESGSDVKDEIQESLALSMAYAGAISCGCKLSDEEINEIVDTLFSAENHKYTPDGKMIINVFSDSDIDKLFK